jgi:hypothetical protein
MLQQKIWDGSLLNLITRPDCKVNCRRISTEADVMTEISAYLLRIRV